MSSPAAAAPTSLPSPPPAAVVVDTESTLHEDASRASQTIAAAAIPSIDSASIATPSHFSSSSLSSMAAASSFAASLLAAAPPVAVADAYIDDATAGVVMENDDDEDTSATANLSLAANNSAAAAAAAASSSEYASSPDVSPTPSPSHRQQLHTAAAPNQQQSSYERSFFHFSSASAAASAADPLHAGSTAVHRCSEFECLSAVASYCLYCGFQCSAHALSVHALLEYRHHTLQSLDERRTFDDFQRGWQHCFPETADMASRAKAEAAREARRKKDRRRKRHTRGLGRGNPHRLQESSSPYSRGFDPLRLVFAPSQSWLEWSFHHLLRPLFFSTVHMVATEWMADAIQSGIRKWTRPPVQEVEVTQIPVSEQQSFGRGGGESHLQLTMPVGPQRSDPHAGMAAATSGATTRR